MANTNPQGESLLTLTRDIDREEKEARYVKGADEPATSSVLISSSPYLNSPVFRDLYAQMGLKRDGHDLPGAYLVPDAYRAMTELQDIPALIAMLDDAKAAIPEFRDWLDERYTSTLKPALVAGCAPGTLGARVHAFMVESGLDIDFMFTGQPGNDNEYINKRRIQVHDIEHMVTGFDPSPAGELALTVANTVACQSYFAPELAAELNRFNMFLVSTTLMRASCHYPAVVPAMLEAVQRGRMLGLKQRRPMFMNRWEEHLDRTIADIRLEFGFEDGPADGEWEWTFAAFRG